MKTKIGNALKWKTYYAVRFCLRNKIILDDLSRRTERNKVNLHWWSLREKDIENLGDMLSEVIVNNVLALNKIDANKKVSNTRHLYAIGSILDSGYQDATIWGSGFWYSPATNVFWKNIRKLDIRAVRGPRTRETLQNLGYDCPEIYGDPAILLPLFYRQIKKGQEGIKIVSHYSENNYSKFTNIEIRTTMDSWKRVVDEICSADLIISSTLHGIILAEAYGVPAIMLKQKNCSDLYKYEDYYWGTGRTVFPVATSVEDALTFKAPELPDLRDMQKKLLNVFPIDLYQ